MPRSASSTARTATCRWCGDCDPRMTAMVVSLGVVVLLLAVLVVGLLRSHAEILRELHALRDVDRDGPRSPVANVRPGVALPRGAGAEAQGRDLVGIDPDGDAVKIAVSGTAHSTLLLFLSSGCLSCRGFWDALADPAANGLRPSIRPVAVTKGPDHESLSAVAALAPGQVATVLSSQAWDDYDVPVAPYAILVEPSGMVVGEGASATWVQLRDLMHQALDDASLGADSDLRARVEGLRRRRGATGNRDAATDEALLAAGIGPDHASLWPEPSAPGASSERATD